MSAEVPPLVVVLLCILGGGAFVTVLAAFGKTLFNSKDETERDFNQRSPAQDSYLRRVREINQLAILGQARQHRKDERRQRDREMSDVEEQSGASYSNVGGHHVGGEEDIHHYTGGHRSQRHDHHTPVTYYEEEYYGPDESNVGYEGQSQQYREQQHEHQYGSHYEQQYERQYDQQYEQQYERQQRHYNGNVNPYSTQNQKPGPTETWQEVPR